MEDKANGPAVISALRHDVSGLIAITPEGGKVARAQSVSPQVESCNVYLPHPAIAPWVESFIDECSSFPNGKYDDQVDQMTQVLNWLRGTVAAPECSPPVPARSGQPRMDGVMGTAEPARFQKPGCRYHPAGASLPAGRIAVLSLGVQHLAEWALSRGKAEGR